MTSARRLPGAPRTAPRRARSRSLRSATGSARTSRGRRACRVRSRATYPRSSTRSATPSSAARRAPRRHMGSGGRRRRAQPGATASASISASRFLRPSTVPTTSANGPASALPFDRARNAHRHRDTRRGGALAGPTSSRYSSRAEDRVGDDCGAAAVRAGLSAPKYSRAYALVCACTRSHARSCTVTTVGIVRITASCRRWRAARGPAARGAQRQQHLIPRSRGGRARGLSHGARELAHLDVDGPQCAGRVALIDPGAGRGADGERVSSATITPRGGEASRACSD